MSYMLPGQCNMSMRHRGIPHKLNGISDLAYRHMYANIREYYWHFQYRQW